MCPFGVIYFAVLTGFIIPTLNRLSVMKPGTLLRKLRDQKKLSQSSLAEQVGVSQSTYCNWESDQSSPNAKNYVKLAAVFGVDLKELLSDDLTVTISAPLKSHLEPAVLNAKTLYDDLTNAQKQTILLQQQRIEQLEAENQQLRAGQT